LSSKSFYENINNKAFKFKLAYKKQKEYIKKLEWKLSEIKPERNDWQRRKMSVSGNQLYGKKPIAADETFRFDCHPGLTCFTDCCRNADMYLYPYDIIRLKKNLGISSGHFLEQHTISAFRDNPYFPNVMLRMSAQEDRACTFLSKKGCAVYKDRPFSCRAYPMEQAVSKEDSTGTRDRLHFVEVHSHCTGHEVAREWTVSNWIENQELFPYIQMNDIWVDIDLIFRENPWNDQGIGSQAFKMAFMACYNIDMLKTFIFESSFLTRFNIEDDRRRLIEDSDTELLKLGFDWIKFFLTGKGPLSEA